MHGALLVGVGAVARYTLAGWATTLTPDWRFPVGTFLVNFVGCLAAGGLAGLAEEYDLFAGEARLFLFTGMLGGFTTFSAFGLETVALVRRGEVGVAVGYVVLSVLCGLAAVGLGVAAVRWVSR